MNHINLPQGKKLDIAVVGSGIAGMSAAWLLSQRHTVTVYERESRLGGHSNTVDVSQGQRLQAVDTGFIVYNEKNYPNLTSLFEHLGVPTKLSDMSFSVSKNDGSFEFGSTGMNALVGQRSNIINIKFWGMIADIFKFYRDAKLFLHNNFESTLTLGEFLIRYNYNESFIKNFILPMGGAIWSSDPEEIRSQPAETFIHFFQSHGLLDVRHPIPWKTVDGGSREYIKRLTSQYLENVRFSCLVKKIIRHLDGIEIIDHRGKRTNHNAVVIATHADHALSILADPSKAEQEILGSFRYTGNEAILHSDDKLMPKRKRVWSSWNYMDNDYEGINVTYWMNRLQSIDGDRQLFVSINPKYEPNKNTVHGVFKYEHPLFDFQAWRSQKNLWSLQGIRNTWYCGSYFGYGFHEDALQSGLAVAEQLGAVTRPWKVNNQSERIHVFS